MAFDYKKFHFRAMYHPDGRKMDCHSEQDEIEARKLGFGHTYVKSHYPTTMWNASGVSRQVGDPSLTKEQNDAEVERMKTQGWSTEHVEVPAAIAAAPAATAPAGISLTDLAPLVDLAAQVKLAVDRITELETALLEAEEQKDRLEKKVVELQKAVADTKPTDVSKIMERLAVLEKAAKAEAASKAEAK